MSDFCALIQGERSISVCLYPEHPELMTIGQQMEQLCPEAYMNGYNWEAFLRFYLGQAEPQLLEGMGSDPEAGMFAAYYASTPENLEKAKQLLEVIRHLIQQPEQIYQLLRQQGSQIEWD